ncbi:sodium/hydrogen exchanger 2-like [Oncorhynchus mykiss]|uniref:sodium/hydrogen exchanger 2-like n=1 Tax=Oncorhynchus mykiss TaxID=8022 RepID=UPI0018783E02|nr:sodium/hydrogen exchanger 2-like [Oncorhynchus mykiss]
MRHSVKEEPPAILSPIVFFLYMLPLIVLNDSYFLPTRTFLENVGMVLCYALVCTLWNSIGVGLSLYVICQSEAFWLKDTDLQENLLLASILSVVDPLAMFGGV